ncbi:MAG: hydroxypyruvate isomerase [Rhodocyclaceae bacterium]|nr:hydroxypyruvate isomerase [Rhodocyclaceae bacterium]
MPKFAANLSLLFSEVPFLDRFEAAQAAGFSAVEIQFPYEHAVGEIKKRLKQHRLELVLHNLPAGDWAAGERGIACHPGRRDEFRKSVAMAVAYARELGVRQLNCLAGIPPEDVAVDTAYAVLRENLRHAADILSADGIRLLIEPINTHDVPGFFLCHSAQAVALIKACEHDNIFLQYDVYHMQRMEGDLANTLSRHLPYLGHIQIADNPGRHEPGSGEINYPFLFAHLDRIGYQGWIGCEYLPKVTTLASLDWFAPYCRPHSAGNHEATGGARRMPS